MVISSQKLHGSWGRHFVGSTTRIILIDLKQIIVLKNNYCKLTTFGYVFYLALLAFGVRLTKYIAKCHAHMYKF